MSHEPTHPAPATPPTHPAPEPVAPVAAGSTAPAPRGSGALAALPWALVALLTGLSVFFGTMWWQTHKELATLRATPVATSPATTQPAASPSAPSSTGAGEPALTAQPTTGERAQQLLALAHRKANDPMAIGKVDAPITIVEWADYRCPFCAKWALETRPALMPYVESGSVRIEFRDLPIFGDESMLAHEAARAAGMQGRYWEYYDQVWKLHTGQGHPTFTQKEAEACATRAGVTDMAKFRADMKSDVVRKAVEADATEAKQLGLDSTPFFLINTTPVSGALPTEQFVSVLEQYGAKK